MGLGTLAFLTSLTFLVLKLVGVISWGWLLVFLPVIIATGIGVVVLFFVGLLMVVAALKSVR